MQKFNYRISNLRVIGILSVMLGHAMILYSPDWGLLRTDVSSPLFATMKGYINLYQMPLFFTISGYLFYHAIVKDWDPKAFISKKVLRLLVPYFSIAFLWLIPIRLIIGYYSIDQLPVVVLSVLTATSNSHLWFVFTLFGIFMLYYCLFYHAAKIGKVQFLIPIFTLTNALINRYLPPPLPTAQIYQLIISALTISSTTPYGLFLAQAFALLRGSRDIKNGLRPY